MTHKEAAALVALPFFRWVENVFWATFLLLPFFTGLLQFDWLPNESYDEDRHELIDSYWESDGNGNGSDVPTEWRDKETNEVYTKYQFSDHRYAEGKRIGATCFFYGLIGCAFFAWVQSARQNRSFYDLFGRATLLDLGIAVILGLLTSF